MAQNSPVGGFEFCKARILNHLGIVVNLKKIYTEILALLHP